MLEFDHINFILSDRRYIMNVQDLLEIEAEERQRLDEKKRARTAPSKTPRKTWDVGSVELTTDRGKRKLRAPGMQLYFKTSFLSYYLTSTKFHVINIFILPVTNFNIYKY